MNIDVVVAGAGIWGCTVARRLAEAGRQVLVLEKRPVVGGNVRCEIDPETGIEIHTYGSHIFHTHIPEVWNFVNRFVSFNGYQHKVLASYQGKTYHLPLGLTLINKFFGVELKPAEVQPFLDGTFTPPTNNATLPTANYQLPTPDRRQAIFDAFFRGYTSKQWGKSPEEIDPSIIQRVPVRSNYDTNYFNDYNQGIPTTGYNALFDRLLNHPNITVETEMTLKLAGDDLRAFRNPDSTQPSLEIHCGTQGKHVLPVYYSGPIDSLFNYKFGHLPWRTLRFEKETLNLPDFQGTSVVNYPDIDVPYTRIHEFKHYHPEGRWSRSLESKSKGFAESIHTSHFAPSSSTSTSHFDSSWGFDSPKTVIMREYSATWRPGDEPYYPVNNPESAALLARYQAEVERLNHGASTSNFDFLTVGGRLGQYKYFDMDKSIEAALCVMG